ncbi:MAG: hypothetical protein EOO05_00740 [Chitinophagaceae bacterium]|nr:MAG: hypothetical protein EOO05_00740 [Chitinophagaceae bacterium]
MKYFNRKVFITASMITGLLVVISMFSTLEAQSGKNGSNAMMKLLAGLFNVLRFPAHTVIGSAVESSTLLFCAGLLLNCLFYGFIYERVYSFFQRRRQNGAGIK